MDLHLATYFVAVIDHGGITKAAQALYISQPSLSQAIRTLERKLGVTLFDRTGRRLELTEAGARVEVIARRVLADVERARQRVGAVRELRSGTVDVITEPAFAIAPLVAIVRDFRTRFDRVIVRILAADGPAGILAALRSGRAEIGLIDSSAEHSTFASTPLGTQDLVLAASPSLSVDADDDGVVARESVRSLPLLLDLSDPSTGRLLADLIADGARNVAVDCAHPPTIRELVARGVGATIAPRESVAEQIPHATTYSLDPPLRRDFGLITRSGQPSPAAAAFLAVARQTCGAPTRVDDEVFE
ncbi:LysR family transcriptional regulator [Gordonia sputi]